MPRVRQLSNPRQRWGTTPSSAVFRDEDDWESKWRFLECSCREIAWVNLGDRKPNNVRESWPAWVAESKLRRRMDWQMLYLERTWFTEESTFSTEVAHPKSSRISQTPLTVQITDVWRTLHIQTMQRASVFTEVTSWKPWPESSTDESEEMAWPVRALAARTWWPQVNVPSPT